VLGGRARARTVSLLEEEDLPPSGGSEFVLAPPPSLPPSSFSLCPKPMAAPRLPTLPPFPHTRVSATTSDPALGTPDDSPPPPPPPRWSLSKTRIGTGASARVYLGEDRSNQNEGENSVAIKQSRSRSYDQLEIEATLMKTLRHDNVVCMFGKFEHCNRMHLVFEFVPGGDLLGLINEMCYVDEAGNKIPENADPRVVPIPIVAEISGQLALAVRYCHSQNVVHYDVKPDNVLVDRKTMRVVLIDFGFATIVPSPDVDGVAYRETGRIPGSLAYAAPEIFIRPTDGIDPYKCDVWSLAITLFGIGFGWLPVSLRMPSSPRAAHDHRVIASTKVQDDQGGLFKRMLQGMLDPEFDIRPTMDEVCDTDWIKMAVAMRDVAQAGQRRVSPLSSLSPHTQSSASISESPESSDSKSD